MSDKANIDPGAERYVNWLREKLSSEQSEVVQLTEVERTLRQLEASLSQIFGATIPGEHYTEVAQTLIPELRAWSERLRRQGVEPLSVKKRVSMWPEPPDMPLAELRSRILALPAAEDRLGPFRLVRKIGVGGLLAVGFARDTDYLLVVSHNGKGVFDWRTGERVARDAGADTCKRYPKATSGIGPIKRRWVALMGLDGGKPLPLTAHGWQLSVIHPDYDGMVWIAPPGSDVNAIGSECRGLRCGFEELRAMGFSHSGDALVFAQQHTLHIFRKESTRDD